MPNCLSWLCCADDCSCVGVLLQLLTVYETGLPHSLDPNTLQTLGPDDLGGALTLGLMAAHFRMDIERMVRLTYLPCETYICDENHENGEACGEVVKPMCRWVVSLGPTAQLLELWS